MDSISQCHVSLILHRKEKLNKYMYVIESVLMNKEISLTGTKILVSSPYNYRILSYLILGIVIQSSVMTTFYFQD